VVQVRKEPYRSEHWIVIVRGNIEWLLTIGSHPTNISVTRPNLTGSWKTWKFAMGELEGEPVRRKE